VVANTGARHDQLDSPFAARRREAEAGLRVLQAADDRALTLRDVDPEMLERQRPALLAADPSGVLWRRCRHVVTENARVLAVAAALARRDLPAVRALLAAEAVRVRGDF